MKGLIKIENRAETGGTVIDIEGVIGVAEEMQFTDKTGIVSTYGSLRALLDMAGGTETASITVNIRSAGGSVNDALLIYDFLRSTGAEVTTRCFGYVASAATIIAQAASPGKREISANSLYLVHNSSCETEGNSADMAATGEMLEQTDNRIAVIYASCSGREASVYRELMNENGGRGKWLSPEEVVGYGLADVVIDGSRIKRRERRLVKNLMLPELPVGGLKGLFRKVFSQGAGDVSGVFVDGGTGGGEAGATGVTDNPANPDAEIVPTVADGETPSASGEAAGNSGEQASTSGQAVGKSVNAPAVEGKIDGGAVVDNAISGKNDGGDPKASGQFGPCPDSTSETGGNASLPANLRNRDSKGRYTGRVHPVVMSSIGANTLQENPARRAAKATRTKPCEDPSVHEVRRPANQEAYLEDLKKIRSL